MAQERGGGEIEEGILGNEFGRGSEEERIEIFSLFYNLSYPLL